MIVVKVGGSLFDHPRLGPGLRAYLDTLTPGPVVFVPGGGPAADVVRDWDRVHRLGDEAAHWLALRSLTLAADFLAAVLGDAPATVLDPFAFAVEDERRPGALPHAWDVTTDSIAARVAVVRRADRLVLLKSVTIPPGTPWAVAADYGWVDQHFPKVIAASGLHVEAVDFRRYLDALPD